MNEHQYDRAPAALEVRASSGIDAQTGFINRVYGWMTLGLAITGATAWFVAGNEAIRQLIFGSRGGYLVLVIATFLVAFGLSAAINRISAAAAGAGFIFFSVLNGAMLSSVFLVYELGSIATTFFATSGTFGVMSLYGYLTRRDLTTIGNLALMGLLGVIIASLLNMIWYSSKIDLIISYIGLAIFVVLTAYDTQKIKRLSLAIGDGEVEAEAGKKYAIIGALELYLDFINIFLYLLRLFGNRR